MSRWTEKELEDIDTQDLLSETGEKNPEAAIDMMKLLLDTVGDKLQERDVAYQFLGWDTGQKFCMRLATGSVSRS